MNVSAESRILTVGFAEVDMVCCCRICLAGAVGVAMINGFGIAAGWHDTAIGPVPGIDVKPSDMKFI